MAGDHALEMDQPSPDTLSFGVSATMKLCGGWGITRRSEGRLPMAEDGSATSGSGRQRSGASYAHESNRFVAWSQAAGKRSLPSTPDDVAAYLEYRAYAGARASTIKVAAAAIAHNHKEAGFDVPHRRGVARTVLEELTQDHSPGPVRALPLDLDCYLAIRKTAHEPRSGRGGGMERVSNARRRGAMDVAMIGLMRDARLQVSEAAELTWGDLQQVPGGSGRVCVWESGFRMVSADTMRLLSSVRRGSDETEELLGMRPNQIAIRIGAAARQAGLGEGYSGDSPRLGMIRDIETLGVLLRGSYRHGCAPHPAAAGRPTGSGHSPGTQAYAPAELGRPPRPGQQANQVFAGERIRPGGVGDNFLTLTAGRQHQ